MARRTNRTRWSRTEGTSRSRGTVIWPNVFTAASTRLAVRSGTESLEDVIFVMGKPAIQAGIIGAIAGVGDETGRRIAASPQVFGQRREVPRNGDSPSTPSSWGHRPVKKLACEASVQGAGARASVEADPPPPAARGWAWSDADSRRG